MLNVLLSNKDISTEYPINFLAGIVTILGVIVWNKIQIYKKNPCKFALQGFYQNKKEETNYSLKTDKFHLLNVLSFFLNHSELRLMLVQHRFQFYRFRDLIRQIHETIF